MILVPGCQTDEIIESRVDAAIYLIRNLCTNIEIVFTGGAPKRERVRIRHEGARMKSIFEDRVQQGALSEKDLTRIQSIKIFTETTSQNTMENAKQFFDGDYIRPEQAYFLYLVTSTFHLLRFVKDWEKTYNAAPNSKRHIQRFILCGADDIYNLSSRVKTGNYIKQMFFDIYLHLMKQDYFYKT